MKRSFAFFALVCAILFGCAATADAQSKALKKDVKKRVKELTKDGSHWLVLLRWSMLFPSTARIWRKIRKTASSW